MLNNKMKNKESKGFKVFKSGCTILGTAVIVVVLLAGAYKLGLLNNILGSEAEAADIFEETVDVTVYDVRHELQPIGEMVTAEYAYEGKEKIEDSLSIGNQDLFFTKHTIDVDYNGVIKAGYEMDDVDITIDVNDKVINITLPEAQIFDNYVDTYTTIENNNIINNIKSDEVQTYIDEVIEPRELEEAEKDGIYDLAEESAKDQMKKQLGYFEKFGYSIEFSSSTTTK